MQKRLLRWPSSQITHKPEASQDGSDLDLACLFFNKLKSLSPKKENKYNVREQPCSPPPPIITREAFNWVSKANSNCFAFALLHPMIGSKFSRHFINQLEVKPKSIVARVHSSRASCRLRVVILIFDWFAVLSPSFLIDQSNY